MHKLKKIFCFSNVYIYALLGSLSFFFSMRPRPLFLLLASLCGKERFLSSSGSENEYSKCKKAIFYNLINFAFVKNL